MDTAVLMKEKIDELMSVQGDSIQPNANGLVGIRGILVQENKMTGDDRFIDPGAVYWEEGPWSLMGQHKNDGHQGAPLVGRIDALTRQGNDILFSGVIDTKVKNDAGELIGLETVRLIANKLLRGISVDSDNFDPELRTEDGRNVDKLTEEEANNVDPDKLYLGVLSMRVRGGTMLPMPAFVDTELELFEVGAEVASGFDGIIASGTKETLPPMWWFEDPKLLGPTPLTITDDGRIFGHIVENWNECHIGMSGVCTKPPRSKSNYSYYTRGGVQTWCDSCQHEEMVAVGPITATTGHAGMSMSKDQTIKHYDDSGSVVANVAAGEDKFGIWIAGRIAPEATKQQVESLLAIGVSGDWRRINGSLELVAVLSVPVPGYPIARRTQAHAASGVQTALITPATGRALVGGPVKVDQWLLVGEHGPETFMFKHATQITPIKKVIIAMLEKEVKPKS